MPDPVPPTSDCTPETFEAAFRAHYAGLCDFVDKYVHSREVANDLVQDLFVAIWDRCDAGDSPPLTAAYLYTGARNRAIQHLRHERIVSTWAERTAHEPARTGIESDAEIREQEVAKAIERALADLPARCREVFLLSRQQELSYAEIAEALGISIKTVETQMWRALKSLRSSLAPYLGVAITVLSGWGSQPPG